jgi:hypothetical protein
MQGDEECPRRAVVLKAGHPANLPCEHFAGKVLRALGIPAPLSRPLTVAEACEAGRVLSKASMYDRPEDKGAWQPHYRRGSQQWLLIE